MNYSLEAFTRLEVIRRVHGAEQLVDRIGALASRVFVGDQTTALQITDPDIVGNTPRIVAIPRQIFTLYDANSLRVPLLERRATPEKRLDGKFSSARRLLREGRSLGASRKGQPGRPALEPIRKQLHYIQLAADFPNDERMPVKLSSVGVRFSEGVENGDIELCLEPSFDHLAAGVLIAQAKKCSSALKQISKPVSQPESPQRVGIPILRVRESVDGQQIERFCSLVCSELLPTVLHISQPEVIPY